MFGNKTYLELAETIRSMNFLKGSHFLLVVCLGANFFLSIACGNKMNEVSRERFKIEIEILIGKKDKLEIFFKEDEMEGYDEHHKVQKMVDGKSQVQKLEFFLPSGIFPSSIRLDLGENIKQEQVQLQHIKFTFNEELLEMSLDEIPFFFVPNQYINYDRSSGRAELNELNSKYDPYLESTPLLMKKLDIIESLAK